MPTPDNAPSVRPAGVSAGGDRGIPGIEAAAVALSKVDGTPGVALDEWAEEARVVVAAFLAVEPPADVLRALLEAQPEATVEALRDPPVLCECGKVCDSDRHQQGHRALSLDPKNHRRAAVASLKPKENPNAE